MISWIDDRAIIELFHRKSRVIPVPGRGWDNSGGKKGDYRIQHTLAELSRYKSSARLVNACTGPASRTNTLKRGFSASRFARASLAVPAGLCMLLLFLFKLRFENLPSMIKKSKGESFQPRKHCLPVTKWQSRFRASPAADYSTAAIKVSADPHGIVDPQDNACTLSSSY